MQVAGNYAHGSCSRGNRALRGMAAGAIARSGASHAFGKYVKLEHIGKKAHARTKKYLDYTHGQAGSGAGEHRYKKNHK